MRIKSMKLIVAGIVVFTVCVLLVGVLMANGGG